MNEIYLSMGALVERRNGYDTAPVARVIPQLTEEGYIAGGEFMMITKYYGSAPALAASLVSEGCRFPTFHTDKNIGSVLSDGAVAAANGETGAIEMKRRALDMFKENCETACAAGSKRLVLHLWGGLSSDLNVSFNAEALEELIGVADAYGLKILVENVPSVKRDPLSNWRELEGYLDRIGLVFDTRFATCHRQPGETLSDCVVAPHIEHVHISDYRGGFKEFKCLRPVFHPGEGICDYPLIFGKLKEARYGGSFTLESPGITDGGPAINAGALRRSLGFIASSIG